jgi:hypothetical protein
MKNIPEKFLNALKALINSDSKEAKRLAETLENEPEKSAERVEHLLGSQTGPIKLSK